MNDLQANRNLRAGQEGNSDEVSVFQFVKSVIGNGQIYPLYTHMARTRTTFHIGSPWSTFSFKYDATRNILFYSPTSADGEIPGTEDEHASDAYAHALHEQPVTPIVVNVQRRGCDQEPANGE
jgi:hypothetical protein